MKSTIYAKLAQILFINVLLLTYVNASIQPIMSNTCCSQNTVIVSGQSTVTVQPDIAVISVGISATQKTSQQAVKQVNDKISQITQILSENSINSTDISTSNLNVYPEYNYANGVSQIIGQNAQQSLSVKVRNINSTGGNLGPLIDSLVNVNGIQLNGLSFDKEDKSAAQTQARKQAFNNAKVKANDYASFAQRSLGRAITVLDGVSNQAAPVPLADYKVANLAMTSAPTTIQVGSLDISYSLQVTFALR